MSKSKYPQQLDTSIEIPPVRDNVLETGSEVINSLRSAIFNIEKTLGLNPQGAAGNTLSERLNRSLDSNGNILESALDKANILSGPIIDNDVSKVAAIQESKLKLDYPTTLLQDEISILNSQIGSIQNILTEVSNELAVHLNQKSINQHKSLAISVAASTKIPDDISIQELIDGDVQSTFEDLINSHINYTGVNISGLNNSHLANQIFFNKENVNTVISSDDVQGVIEELIFTELNSQVKHQNLMHNNGMLQVGKINSPADLDFGNLLSEDFLITFSKSDGNSNGLTTISIPVAISLDNFTLNKSDILTITDSSDVDSIYVGDYEIASFTTVSGEITELTIYGSLGADSTSLTLGKITKNTQTASNFSGLLCAVREEATLTSARSIQICNPNAVRVISDQIKPYEITSIKRFIGIKIDDNDIITVDLYKSGVDHQTIDTIVSRINEQVAEDTLSFAAYRLDISQSRSELVIAYNIPDDETTQHTMIVSRQVDNGIDAAGYSYIEDVNIKSLFGSNYFISGQSFDGLKVKLDSTELSFISSTIQISSSASAIDFLEIGIKSGDLLIITNSVDQADNGTYVISAVSADQLTLNVSQLPSGFNSTSQTDTRFLIYSNIVSFEDLVFEEVGGSFGSVLGDIFLDKNQDIFFDKRFEYTASILSSDSLFTLVDFKGDIADKEFSLVISGGTDVVTLTLDGGKSVEVRGDNSYVWITSGNKNVNLKFMISDIGDLNTQLTGLGSDLTTTLFGFSGINDDSNLLISRIAFDNFDGRISGGEKSARSRSILGHGSISEKSLTEQATYVLAERPINDLRSNGVVYGLEISNATSTSNFYTFDVQAGVCYIHGKRIEVKSQTAFISDSNITSIDKIFIAVDPDGLIKVEASTPSCQSPFESSDYCILSSIEYDTVNFYNQDFRLFINDLDLKILNSITVSPEPGMAHFTDFSKAVRYAKRFSQLFTKAGVPTIHLKSGTHEITTVFSNASITYADWALQSASILNQELYDGLAIKGLILDFPVNVIGEGDSSILKLRNQYVFSDITYNFRGTLGIVGNGFTDFTVPIDKFTAGFSSFKNFKLDNCRFIFPDFNINDGVDPYFNGIDLDSLVFDMRNFTVNPTDTDLGPKCIELDELNDTTTNKGNLSVSNCKFLVETDGNIRAVIGLPNATRTKNLIIANNILLGSDSSSTVRLLDKNVWGLTSADSGANITITGNLSGSNFNTISSGSKAHMVVGAIGWGDRISRSLHIGGLVTGESSATFTEAVEGSQFNYNATYTKTKNIFFESLADTALGDSGAGTVFGTLSVNGREWRTIEFDDNTTDIMRVRLEVLPGETLDNINILFGTEDPADSVFGGFSLRITSENAYGDETVEQVYTSMGSVVGGLGSSLEAGAQGVTNLGFVGALNKNYIANIKRTVTSGFKQHMLYIQYTTNVTDVQGIGGLT